MKRKIFDWAMKVAQHATPWRTTGAHASVALKIQWKLADRLVYKKIRLGTGGRLRIISSGGAPLSKALAEFFWTVGIPIYQGYGLTETSPIVSNNYPQNRVGSSGKPIANVQVRIAEDGEILVKGPCVMQGYYKNPEATREVLTEDGWLRTGDIGHLDADGYLYITDRKKDLLKTAAGKFVAPQPIENALKTSPYILNAMVVGDKRKFIVAHNHGVEDERAGLERSEEHTSELQSLAYLVCRLLLEKKKKPNHHKAASWRLRSPRGAPPERHGVRRINRYGSCKSSNPRKSRSQRGVRRSSCVSTDRT